MGATAKEHTGEHFGSEWVALEKGIRTDEKAGCGRGAGEVEAYCKSLFRHKALRV